MSVKTISGFQGYGYRIQLIRRNGLSKDFSVVNNRRVVISTGVESLAKDVFLNQVAGVVRQVAIDWGKVQ